MRSLHRRLRKPGKTQSTVSERLLFLFDTPLLQSSRYVSVDYYSASFAIYKNVLKH